MAVPTEMFQHEADLHLEGQENHPDRCICQFDMGRLHQRPCGNPLLQSGFPTQGQPKLTPWRAWDALYRDLCEQTRQVAEVGSHAGSRLLGQSAQQLLQTLRAYAHRRLRD